MPKSRCQEFEQEHALRRVASEWHAYYKTNPVDLSALPKWIADYILWHEQHKENCTYG